MENELLELWSADRKSVMFITHDLEEAISLSDRVVVLSAGPATRPIGEYVIDLPRPRDVAEIRLTPRFVELHTDIWHVMKDEVLKGYAQSQAAGGATSRLLLQGAASERLIDWNPFWFYLAVVFAAWHILTATNILPPFFFGRPLAVLEKIWEWFASGKIYAHLWITLVETVLAFIAGTLLRLGHRVVARAVAAGIGIARS